MHKLQTFLKTISLFLQDCFLLAAFLIICGLIVSPSSTVSFLDEHLGDPTYALSQAKTRYDVQKEDKKNQREFSKKPIIDSAKFNNVTVHSSSKKHNSTETHTYGEHGENLDNAVLQYERAVKLGLPKGTSTTVPATDGYYHVYIKPTSNRSFNKSARLAVSTWRTLSGMPVRTTRSKKKSQIRIYLVNYHLSKPEKDGAQMVGTTDLYQGALTYKTTIKVSQPATRETRGNYQSIVEHELGHALGLDHNNRKNDIMNAYSNSNHAETLSRADILRARKNYKIIVKAVNEGSKDE